MLVRDAELLENEVKRLIPVWTRSGWVTLACGVIREMCGRCEAGLEYIGLRRFAVFAAAQSRLRVPVAMGRKFRLVAFQAEIAVSRSPTNGHPLLSKWSQMDARLWKMMDRQRCWRLSTCFACCW
jgi:hypothetical protein